MTGARKQLLRIFEAALAAVDPERLVREAVQEWSPEPVRHVIAAGKAAAAMARGYEAVHGTRLAEGLVVTKDGHRLNLDRCQVVEAGHPLPDQRSVRAGRAALELARRTGEGEELVVLVSGGASSLLTTPAGELSLEDLATTTRILLEAGADIHQMNGIRKRLTLVSGGRLAQAAAHAGAIRVLLISDVPGDDPAVIASGPCAADPSTFEEAMASAKGLGAWSRLPTAVKRHLEDGRDGLLPTAGDPQVFDGVETQILASNMTAMEACDRHAATKNLKVNRLAEPLSGEARQVGRALARYTDDAPPGLVVAGGETTVTVRGAGRGGRSQELALGAAVHWARSRRGPNQPHLLAVGTDGTDGPTDAAGAFADPGTVTRGEAAGVSAERCLEENDAYRFFDAEGGLLRTGPTRTNVMDLALVLIEPPRG